MNKIKVAINTYLSAKKLFEYQIADEIKSINNINEEINRLMQNKIYQLRMKRNDNPFDNYYKNIARHMNNIETLKSGDVEFLHKLMIQKNKSKQEEINYTIMELIDLLIEGQLGKKDKYIDDIWKMMQGDIDTYDRVTQYMNKLKGYND